jgi:hypothetical protein
MKPASSQRLTIGEVVYFIGQCVFAAIVLGGLFMCASSGLWPGSSGDDVGADEIYEMQLEDDRLEDAKDDYRNHLLAAEATDAAANERDRDFAATRSAEERTNTGGTSGSYDFSWWTGGDLDCRDFDTQAEAQAFYRWQGGPARDEHLLDSDADGVACESLL